MIKKIRILWTLLGCALSAMNYAQCRITVEAPDSLPFLFSVNETSVNQTPILSLTLDQHVSGKVNFKASFLHRPELSFSQVITIKKGTAINYAIERSRGSLKFILKSESVFQLPDIPHIGQPNEPLAADSLETIHLGCFPVTDEEDFLDMVSAADGQHFESQKLTTMSGFASDQCIRTEQLKLLMGKLSQEDNKLALLSAAKGHIYDPSQLNDVLSEFFLARNKSKAAELILTDR